MAMKKFTKDRILTAAYELSLEVGINNLSMRKIADKVGCSVMPLYEEFDSKEELIKELSTFNELLYNLHCENMYDRYKRLLHEGLKSPTFFLSVVNYDVVHHHDEEIIQNLIKLMKRDDRLQPLSDSATFSLNTRIEIYIVGLVYTYQFVKLSDDRNTWLENVMLETIEFIITGFLKEYSDGKSLY